MRIMIASEPGSDRPNEDWVGAVPGIAVVLDGVTVMDGMEQGCRHGTPWYVNQLGTAMLTALAGGTVLEHECTMAEALHHAIAQTAFLHSDTCQLDAPGAPSAAVGAIRVHGGRLEYLVLADVTVALGLHGFAAPGFEPQVKIITDARVEESVAGLHSGTPHVAQLVAQRRAADRNREGGYWVAAADPEAAAHAVTGAVPAADVLRASVLTDGAARLVDMFHAPWSEVIFKVPQMILNEVRTVERSDPECTRWPRFKMSDDATVVALDFP